MPVSAPSPAAPLSVTTVEFALTVGTFRHVTVTVDADTRRDYVLASDACSLLGLPGLLHAITATLEPETKAYLRVTEGEVPVTRLALTLEGLRQLATRSADVDRATRLVTHVERVIRRSRTRRSVTPAPTRWGRQPIRRLVSERGFSARSFVEAANELPLPGVAPLTAAAYAAWSYGGCLPQESLVTRAATLLDVTPAELFDAAVLAAMPHRGRGRRPPLTVGEPGPPASSASVAAPAPRSSPG